jgi:LmbE family N-acetylglucosaminyl deacetylase
MKNTILAIFAHPDDEAFGPAGTLALLAKNYDVQLVSVTNGEHGDNAFDFPELHKVRKEEVIKSANVLGISKVHFLDYEDGSLNNLLYPKITADLMQIVNETHPETIITFEPQGFTGHLDHIAVTSIINHLYYKIDFIKNLLYYCLHEEQRQLISEYFVYFPRGYKNEEIHLSVDIKQVWQQKLKAISAHTSQKKDQDFWVPVFEKCELKEHFIVQSKQSKEPRGLFSFSQLNLFK